MTIGARGNDEMGKTKASRGAAGQAEAREGRLPGFGRGASIYLEGVRPAACVTPQGRRRRFAALQPSGLIREAGDGREVCAAGMLHGPHALSHYVARCDRFDGAAGQNVRGVASR